MPSKPRALKAVPVGAKPEPPKRAKSVTEAAAEGSRRELLVALRSRVASAVAEPNTPARDLAALTRRLQEIAKDIEAIDLSAEQEGRDAVVSPDEDFDATAL